jgi:hypothetical protein
VEWRAREVTAQIAEQVAEDMATAGKMVEVDARRRLLAIREPEFGQGYRRVLALYRLISFVMRELSTITAYIGIPPGEEGSDYGFWIEVGSRTAPANPWLRPALLTNLKNVMNLLSGR